MHINGNAPAVVFHHDAVIDSYFYCNFITVSCRSFIDTVIHHFIHQVVQSFLADTADIHGRSDPYGFQTFQYFNAVSGIIVCHFIYSLFPTAFYFIDTEFIDYSGIFH
jgi:hypothetical protein